MKKILFLLFFAFSNLLAITTGDIQNLYNAQRYRDVCSNQVEKFAKDTGDEGILNLYGMACLKLHEINRLTTPIFKLVKSKEARENAAYFADILFKKKLLYYAVVDDVDISYIRLPKSDYILSMIFDRFVKKDYEKDENLYVFKEKNSDTYYELGKNDDYPDTPRIFLKIYKNDELITEIEYW